jgi:hypothetical protein
MVTDIFLGRTKIYQAIVSFIIMKLYKQIANWMTQCFASNRMATLRWAPEPMGGIYAGR